MEGVKDFVTTLCKIKDENDDADAGGVKNIQSRVTSFINDPKAQGKGICDISRQDRKKREIGRIRY